MEFLPDLPGAGNAPAMADVDAVRGQFGGRSGKEQIQAYRRSLEETLMEGGKEDPWNRAVGSALLGGQEFLERMRGSLQRVGREVRGTRDLSKSLTFEQLREIYCRMHDEHWEVLRDRHGDPGRDLVLLGV